MGNNWKEKAYQLIVNKLTTYNILSETNQKVEYFENISVDYLVNKTLEAMDLVFEATKKKCAEEAGDLYDKDPILNIEKPNLCLK